MSLNLRIARRYLFGKKSTNAINIISGISIFGITIGTAALILTLSVFNGFESLLSNIFNAFNPDLKVSPIKGKRFTLPEADLAKLEAIPGVFSISKTVEEIALFEYRDQQQIGIIKGVDGNFSKVTGLDTTLVAGKYLFKNNGQLYGVFGMEMASQLSLNTNDKFSAVKIYMPLQKNILAGSKEFKVKNIYPAGIYSVKNSDEHQYVLAPFDLVNNLLQSNNQISSLELKLEQDADENDIKASIKTLLGENYRVENKYEQEKTYLKIIQVEKWVSYMIASLTIILIIFNLVCSLWMIVIDKKKDLSILKSMGYTSKDTSNIIMNLGTIITAIGIISGIVIALVIYIIQTNLGLISMAEGFTIESYPVKLKLLDFIIVAITVLILGILASIIPARRAAKISAFVRTE